MSSSGITWHGEPFTITKSSPSSDSVVKLKRLQLPYCSVVPLVRLRPNTEIPLLQAAPLGVSQRWMSKAMSVLLCPECQGLKLGREREKEKKKKKEEEEEEKTKKRGGERWGRSLFLSEGLQPKKGCFWGGSQIAMRPKKTTPITFSGLA